MTSANNPIPLIKVLTRDVPLVAVKYWAQGLDEGNKEFFGITFPYNVFIFKNNTVESWRDSERLKEMPYELAKWVVGHDTEMGEAISKQKHALELAGELLLHPGINSEEMSHNLEKMGNAFSAGFPGLVVSHQIPVWNEIATAKGETLFSKELIAQCIQWRKETENFFDQSVQALGTLSDMLHTGPNPQTGAFIDQKIVAENELTDILLQKGYTIPIQSFSDTEIKGQIASRGIARGKVRIVLSKNDLDKVHVGEILVAPMTTPWYVPAMERAAAFVTDEGGVTCHAAIVAREMKKPCVIGTKFATQVFKDGDMVEVDAEKGIVRIIK